MIQQYVGEITEKHHNRMVSISDSFTPNGRTKVQITWDLSVRAIAADHCEYTLLNDGGLYDRARLVRSLVESVHAAVGE